MNRLAIIIIQLYQKTVSRILPGRCRFHPSCSEYAVECFHYYPFYRAVFKSSWRILRCNPFSKGYFDPVLPDREK